MTSRPITKVRIVRCPKCKQLLPELESLPMYECGGCGTTLQAKNHKKGGTCSGTPEKDPALKNKPEHESEDEKSISSNQERIQSTSQDFSSDINDERDQNESGNCSKERSPSTEFLSGVPSSGELSSSYNEGSPSEAGGIRDDARDRNGSGNCSKERSPSTNFLTGVPSSVELTFSDNEGSPSEAGRIKDDARDRNGSGNCSKERSPSTDLSGAPSSGELTSSYNEGSPSEAGGIREVDGNDENSLNVRSSSCGSELDSSKQSLILLAQDLLDENIASKSVNSSLGEQLEQPQETVCQDFDDARCRDTGEAVESVNHSCTSEELSGQIRNVSKSPVTRSAHAYDGSVSSCDCFDDQVHDQHFNPSEITFSRTQGIAEIAGTKGKSTRDNIPTMNHTVKRNSESQHQMKKYLSMPSSEKHDLTAMDRTNYDHEGSLETRRCGIQAKKQINSPYSEGFHPVKNWMRSQRDGYHSRDPFNPSGSLSGYENGSSSSQGNEAFLCNSSSFYASDNTEYPEEDRMELLRMVDELRDQLKRSYPQSGKANGRTSTRTTHREKSRPLYYNHILPEEEVLQFYDAKFPQHPPGVYMTGHIRPRQYGCSQCMHHADYACLHCYPQDRQCPVRLPSHGTFYNKGRSVAQPGHFCHGMDSDFPIRAHNTQSHDQRHLDHKVNKLYVRERSQPAKRHCRPMAAGAPFIMCRHCFKLLKLPADFLLSTKRCHRLRCGACLEVLEFSLSSRNRLIPYTPSAREVDNSVDAVATGRNIASTSHANDCPHGDPVSFSEDYGRSFCKSCSTEGEPTFLAPPFPNPRSNTSDRKKSSRISAEPMEQRKKNSAAFRQSRNKHQNPVEASEFVGRPSSSGTKLEKLSSETEAAPPVTGSPLHRLMGYSSPSEVINGNVDSDMEESP